MLSLKDYPENLAKYEGKGTSQITISRLFMANWKKMRSAAQACIKIKTIFHIFLELGKIEKPIKKNIKKNQNLFVNWEKLGAKP